MKRAAAYASTMDAAIENSHGDDRTYRAACNVGRDFGLTVEDTIEVLRDWNARCRPPWSEEELRTKIENGMQYGNQEVGWRLTVPRRNAQRMDTNSARTGHDVTSRVETHGEPNVAVEVVSEIPVLSTEGDEMQESTERPSFDVDLVLPVRSIIEMPLQPRQDIVTGVLYERAMGMIFAPRGLGKTRCAFTLADGCTKGSQFFKYGVPRQRRVLYVDGELPIIDLQNMAFEMTGGNPSPLFEAFSFDLFFQRERRPLSLADRDHQVRLIGLLEGLEQLNRRPELIIFDNFSSMSFGIDENDNSAQDDILRFFIELRQRGFANVVIHHTGHDNTHQRGASRREDFLDLSIRLSPIKSRSPHTGCRFHFEFVKLRRKPPNPFSFDCELIEGDKGLVWTFPSEVLPDDIAQRSKKIGATNRGKIHSLLTLEWQKSATIAAKAGLSDTSTREHLRSLESDGLAKHRGKTHSSEWRACNEGRFDETDDRPVEIDGKP
jgi:hypothetical protein